MGTAIYAHAQQQAAASDSGSAGSGETHDDEVVDEDKPVKGGGVA